MTSPESITNITGQIQNCQNAPTDGKGIHFTVTIIGAMSVLQED